MPKIRGTIGTGMTERAIISFDESVPGDVDAQIAAAIEAFSRTSFARRSRDIANQAKAILANSGLPAEISAAYVFTNDGSWRVVTEEPASEEADPEWIMLPQLVVSLGYAIDSPESYSAHLLYLISRVEVLLKANRIDEALATAVSVGEQIKEASIKAAWEEDALRGEKIVEGARQGQRQVYGTEEQKLNRQARYVREFDAARKQGLSRMAAYEAVAKRQKVSVVTVRRAVSIARHKKD